MSAKILTIKSELELGKVAQQVLNLCKNHFFFAFYGNLGAGKTTLIKYLCAALNCEDNVSSPTYSIINEYHTKRINNQEPQTIYHMDFYRLENIDEALNIGVEEYFDHKDAYCFVEWPELVVSLLPENIVTINMERQPDNSRTLSIQYHG